MTGHYKNNLPLYRRKKLLGTAGNLKVNEQSKYKSVPILFLFLVIEESQVGNKQILIF